MQDLAPRPGTEPRPPALSPTHWTTRELPKSNLKHTKQDFSKRKASLNDTLRKQGVWGSSRGHGLKSQATWVQILALPLTS